MLTSREQNELHSLLRQQGSLTQDGCWDVIEVFEEFLKEKREPLSIQEIYDLDKYSHQPFEIYTVRECISWIRKVEKAHGITGGGE